MIEKEMKIPLKAVEYYTLRLQKNPYTHPIMQRNYYLDTNDYAMNKLGITCRIREKNGRYTSEVKVHDRQNTNCSIEINGKPKLIPDMSIFGGLNIRVQGCMETERIILSSLDGCEVALDKNTYLGITDYELEIEYTEDKKRYANNMLQTLASCISAELKDSFDRDFIKRINKSNSKSARFFKRKEELIDRH